MFLNGLTRKKDKGETKAMQSSVGQYQKLFLLLSFFVPLEMMIMVFASGIVYPFGPESILVSDMYHQYMPVFQEFVNKIHAGEGILYSWNMGMGINFFVVFINNLTSPFNWLAFLFPEKNLLEFITYLITFKVGLAGLTSYIYLIKKTKSENPVRSGYFALFFSICYAMSGFVAANYFTIMWLDCVILAPLIFLGLERLVKDGKIGLYVISLALCIYSNFYIAFMICIFLVLYFFALCFMEQRKKNAFLRFAGASLIAGGMASVVIFPILFFIKNSNIETASFPTQLEAYFSAFKVLARHCMLVEVSCEEGIWPNIYCGTAVFLFVPLYVLNKKISWKKKTGSILLLVIFILSFMINQLDYLWHGFNFPTGFPARHSFLYILLLLAVGYDCIQNIEGITIKKIWISFAAAAIFLVLTKYFFQSEDFHEWNWLITLIFVFVYAICLSAALINKVPKMVEWIAIICYVMVVAECSFNMYESCVIRVERDFYLTRGRECKVLYERHKDDAIGFQRFENLNPLTDNDSALIGYPSASLFSSMLNTKLGEFYAKMGMKHGKVSLVYDGDTPFCSALMNVGWVFSWSETRDEAFYRLADKENDFYLFEANYQLPFGYVAPKGYDMMDQGDAISYQNDLVEKLDIDSPLFQEAECVKEGNKSKFVIDQDGIYYAVLRKNVGPNLNVEISETGTYLQEEVIRNYVLNLGQLQTGQAVWFYREDSQPGDVAPDVGVYRIDLETLRKAIETLSADHVTMVQVRDTKVSGRLELEKEGRLILSVPVDPGWTVYVNGKRTDAQTFGGAFIALDLEPGSYEIELEFFPEGLKMGIIGSLISIFAFACIILRKNRFWEILTKKKLKR